MLKLKDIKKTYIMGRKNDKDRQVVKALNGINLEFREHEFVSILGQSGCGKTTLLNIIGGLDQYTSGDLIINGVSTKEYKDKDWDSYRNHRVGFIFQSYNLIPHQTVLQNVELALTLSGVSKKERTKRAKEALIKVGLGDKLKNKPNQLSGGQMQRVSIARALINDPEIILADEPTGALDSKTSVQIMELLKQISSDKLIIMVTHNPDLAYEYSSRIVKLSDGCLIDDSNPYSSRLEREKLEKSNKNTKQKKDKLVIENEKEDKKKEKKKRMSFFTALSLSFKNLLTKKARTILVSIAGSIGIIGIALILALSSGFKGYIDDVQKETLANYPLTIQSSTIDYSSLLTAMMGGGQKENKHENDGIYADTAITEMMTEITSTFKTNDLEKFYSHLQTNYDDIKDNVNNIQYGYKVNIDVYNKDKYKVAPTSPALYDIVLNFCVVFLEDTSVHPEATNKNTGLQIEKLNNGNYILKLNELADEKSQTLAVGIVYKYMGEADATKFSQDKSLVLDRGRFVDLITEFAGIDINMFNAYDIGAVSPMMDNIELIKSQYEVIAKSAEFENKDVLTSLKNNQAVLVLDQNSELDDYVLYALGMVSEENLMNDIRKTMQGGTSDIVIDYNKAITEFKDYKVLVDTDYYVDINSDKTYVNLKEVDDNQYIYYNELTEKLPTLIDNSTNSIEVVAVLRANSNNGCLNTGINYNPKYIEDIISYYNSSVAVTGKFNGEDVNVKENKVAPLSLEKPSSISFYFKSFADKEKVIDFIEKYNSTCEDGETISYSDLTGMIMSSVTTIINAITYVLVAFVSISLVVSSIMIGIITYISVLERIKEIGVLRSIGASKKDVKRVFTAESLIIGFASGLLGVLITLLLTIPINIIIKSFTGISGIASLHILPATILILISMSLTFIAGLIPAKIASKKDPVEALRSE